MHYCSAIYKSTYEEIENNVRDLMYKLYKEHKYLLKSHKLDDTDKSLFQKFVTKNFDDSELNNSILYLSEMLYKHFNKKVIILMDEYDTPMNGWYEHALSSDNIDRHLDEQRRHVMELFRSLFGAALKDNNYLEKAVVTGILRIAKASLFSGLNNLGEDSILDKEYATHFGFTEDELMQLLHEVEMDRDDKALTDLKSWYNGYMIGGLTIYNPWSIMNYLKKRELKGYWIGTSDTTLIENVLMLEQYQEDIQKLIAGETVSAIADPKMVFRDIKSSESAFYNLLLFSGYLTAAKVAPGKADTYNCLLKIPNQEVLEIFEKSILQWLSQKSYIEVSEYNIFIDALLKGDIDFFLNTLRRFLDTTISYYSISSNKKEDFYNTFVTFLMMLIPKSRYRVEQERESGEGRPDLLIIPKTTAEYKNALILEFKHTNKEEDITLEAQKAFDQINERRYETKIHTYEGVQRIFKIGLAFCGKKVEAVHNI